MSTYRDKKGFKSTPMKEEWKHSNQTQRKFQSHSKNKQSHASGSSSRRVISLLSDMESLNSRNIAAFRLEQLIKGKLLDPVGTQILQASKLLNRGCHSPNCYSFRKKIQADLFDESEQIHDVRKLFPDRLDEMVYQGLMNEDINQRSTIQPH